MHTYKGESVAEYFVLHVDQHGEGPNEVELSIDTELRDIRRQQKCWFLVF